MHILLFLRLLNFIVSVDSKVSLVHFTQVCQDIKIAQSEDPLYLIIYILNLPFFDKFQHFKNLFIGEFLPSIGPEKWQAEMLCTKQ